MWLTMLLSSLHRELKYIMLEKIIKSSCGSHAVVTSSSRSGTKDTQQWVPCTPFLLESWSHSAAQAVPSASLCISHWERGLAPSTSWAAHLYRSLWVNSTSSLHVSSTLSAWPDDSRKFQFSNFPVKKKKKVLRACLSFIYSQILYFQAFSAVFYYSLSKEALLERQQLFLTFASQHTWCLFLLLRCLTPDGSKAPTSKPPSAFLKTQFRPDNFKAPQTFSLKHQQTLNTIRTFWISSTVIHWLQNLRPTAASAPVAGRHS